MEKVVDIEKITKLLGKTTSSNANESSNAMALLNKYLKENNLVWSDIFKLNLTLPNNDKNIKDYEIKIQEQEKIMNEYRQEYQILYDKNQELEKERNNIRSGSYVDPLESIGMKTNFHRQSYQTTLNMSAKDKFYKDKILKEQESSAGAKLLRSLKIPYTFNSDYDMIISEHVLTKKQIADLLKINLQTWFGNFKLYWILHKSYFTATRTYHIRFSPLGDEKYLINIALVGY